MSATHEEFRREVHSRGPSDRNFGFVFTTAFLLFGLSPLRHGRPVRVWCLAVSAAFCLITVIRPALLHGANRIWTKCGTVLGRIVNPIVTALLFYLVFSPAAAILRWMGKDVLRLRADPRAGSYWIPRNSADDLSTMKNQF